MSSFMDKYEMVGGNELLKRYAKAGVLPTAVAQIIQLGTSQKALEILRLIIQYKITKKLYKEFSYILKEYDKEMTLPKEQSNKVWFCWLQGIENAPVLVKRCYDSLRKHMPDRQIVVITKENIKEYVSFPQHIMDKLKEGKISRTFFSDILRLELLIKYGGMWVDATVLCTSDDIPQYMYESELFMYQILKPGKDAHSIIMSSWLISSCTNNRILMAVRDMIYEYWKKYDYLMEYGLLHIFISMALEYFQEDYKAMVKADNALPHILLLDAFEPFDKKRFEIIKTMSCFHKLSDKRPQDLLDRTGTYYDMIVNKGIE